MAQPRSRGLRLPIRQRTTGGHVSGWSPNQCRRFAPISSAGGSCRAPRTISTVCGDLVVQSDIDEIQRQDAGERVDQGVADVRRVAARPHRRKREDADEIVDTPL